MPSEIPNGDREHTVIERMKESSGWSNAMHPIWKTIHVAVVMGIVCFFLYINAANFDATEGNAILGIVLVLVIYAFGGDALKLIMAKFGLGSDGKTGNQN